MPGFLTHWRILIETAQGVERRGATWSMAPTNSEALVYPQKSAKRLGANIPTIAYLGALGPDVPYLGGSILRATILGARYKGKKSGKSRWADALHYNRSGDFIRTVLSQLSNTKSETLQLKLLAYAFGYLTHIAGDIIVHPFVNSFAGAFHNQTDPTAFLNLGMHFWVELCQDAATAKSFFHDDVARLSHRRWGHYLRGALRELTTEHEGLSLLTLLIRSASQVYGLDAAAAEEFAREYVEGTKSLQKFLDGTSYYRLLYWILRFQGDISQRFIRHRVEGASHGSMQEITFDQVVSFACAVSTYICAQSAAFVNRHYLYPTGEANMREDYARLCQSLRNWDLDTGYAAEAFASGDDAVASLVLRHSWYVFQDHRPAQR